MSNLADDIRSIVSEVLAEYDLSALAEGGRPAQPAAQETPSAPGIFRTVDAAVAAAAIAQRELVQLPLDTRRAMIGAVRSVVIENNESLARDAVEETGLGNVPDKIVKNRVAALKTPGVEDVEPAAVTDEHGLTLTERAPFGVIGAITPTTNPTSTITSNGIGMVAAGNSVVFNVHPAAKRVSCRLVTLINQAITGAGGPPNVVCAVESPTIESANELMVHRGVALLVVTGGPGVVRAAIKSGKKAICAGPGNPPVVVDETADLVKAGRDIVNGAGFDHNVVCICEKEVLAVETIADRLKEEMRRNGAFELSAEQTAQLISKVIANPGGPGREGSPNKAFVGKSPREIAASIGVDVPSSAKILLCEVGREHPLVWTEQLMPVLPLVRMKNVDEAIDFAVEVEHGFRHTA
ncbi:aldehyde dehydrogenase, partial [Salinispira pacifica]